MTLLRRLSARLFLLPPAALLLSIAAPLHAAGATDPDDPEGVGSDMGYRLYGDARKSKPLLLQNSRPFPVEVFEGQRGVYLSIPAYASREFPCKGRSRLLHVRFVDGFGESAPFQVNISCGRELQFITKRQLSTPAMGVKIPASAPASAAQPPAQEAAPALAAPPPTDDTPPPFLSPIN